MNTLIRRQAEDMEDLKTPIRIAQRNDQTTRDRMEEQRGATTSRFATHDTRIHTIEVGFQELNQWAEKVANKANPEELWDTLMNQEGRIAKLEENEEEGDDDDDGHKPDGDEVEAA